MKVILIWMINDYADNGGGLEYEVFDDIKKAEDKVNELTDDERFSISYCAKIHDEIKFKEVTKITKWEVE